MKSLGLVTIVCECVCVCMLYVCMTGSLLCSMCQYIGVISFSARLYSVLFSNLYLLEKQDSPVSLFAAQGARVARAGPGSSQEL